EGKCPRPDERLIGTRQEGRRSTVPPPDAFPAKGRPPSPQRDFTLAFASAKTSGQNKSATPAGPGMAIACSALYRLATAALAVSVLAGADAARAEDQPDDRPLGVVELFTSQGCNSCPPADELFAELAAKPDLVALSYHVDYWDYLGWRDTLSRKENTER